MIFANVFQLLGLVVSKKNVQVKDLDMQTCSNGREGLELQNIQVFNNREDIAISGKVNVMTFLSAPITVRIPHYVSEIFAPPSIQ
jgi:hypothetical protein